MKDFTREELEKGRPNIDTLDAVERCLTKLYEDEEHIVTEELVECLVFEEPAPWPRSPARRLTTALR